MKKVLLYSDRKAKKVNVDVPEFKPTPFTVVRTVTRYDNGGESMVKPGRGKYFDPKDPNTRIFVILDVEQQDELFIKEIGVLNNSEGWADVIIVGDGTFELRDGAHVESIGTDLIFSIK